jgi:Flp pilus assembly protein TadB
MQMKTETPTNAGLRIAFLRLALLIIGISLLDGVVVWLVKKPLMWAAVIPALIPMLVYPIVIRPMLRRR